MLGKRTYHLTAIAAMALLALGCSQAVDEPFPVSNVEIMPSMTVVDSIGIEVSSRSPIGGDRTQFSTNQIATVWAYTTASPTNSTTPYIGHADTYAQTDYTKSPYEYYLELRPKRYYPESSDGVSDPPKLYFFAYYLYAAVTSATIEKVSIEIYGNGEVMWARDITGYALARSGTQPQPTLSFEHKLHYVGVRIKSDGTTTYDDPSKTLKYYTVKSVTLRNMYNLLELDPRNGTLTTNTSSTISATQECQVPVPLLCGTGSGSYIAAFYISPDQSTVGLDITIEDRNGTEKTYNMPDLTLSKGHAAGTSSEITITFHGVEIAPTAYVSDPWEHLSSGNVSADI